MPFLYGKYFARQNDGLFRKQKEKIRFEAKEEYEELAKKLNFDFSQEKQVFCRS